MATNQAREESDLAAIFRRLFGEMPEPVEYEYVRMPGLHLAAELDDVIEPGSDYVVWQGGELHDGRKLLVVYCRREKVELEPAPMPVGAPGPGMAPAPTERAGTAPTKHGSRRRTR
jgi:hypothetical protein